MINDSKLYNLTEQWLSDHSKPRQMKHFTRTADWVKELKPDADEAMLIAALAHDANRVFKGDILPKINENLHEPDYLLIHQSGGADIVGSFLKKNGADGDLINRVKMLIAKHEEGGNDDQNVIKDADSISFFENNIEHFLETKIDAYGYDNVKDKFNWMYNRITSDVAKNIVQIWYQNAVKSLDEKVNNNK